MLSMLYRSCEFVALPYVELFVVHSRLKQFLDHNLTICPAFYITMEVEPEDKLKAVNNGEQLIASCVIGRMRKVCGCEHSGDCTQ